MDTTPNHGTPTAETPVFSLSVLVTRDEYMESAARQRRARYSGRLSPAQIIGAILFILGVAGALFGSAIDLSLPAALCLILAGIFLACYDGLFAPIFSRGAAAREFDEKPDLQYASTYEVYRDVLAVRNARLEAKLPWAYITQWRETPSMFIIYFGMEYRFVIPKRLLDGGRQGQLKELLGKAG